MKLLFIFQLMSAATAAPKLPTDISLATYLRTAWTNSSALKAETKLEFAANEFVRSARGKYFPHVSIDAIETTGFPASNSALAVTGVMGSPYRSGFSVGVVVEQVLYDFGRIEAALTSARAESTLASAKQASEKLIFLTRAARVYLACSEARSMQSMEEEHMQWAHVILQETSHFTRTGQRSVVDNALIQTEVDTLQLELDLLKRQHQSLLDQLKLFAPADECLPLKDSQSVTLDGSLSLPEPSALLAKAELEIASARAAGAHADQLPKLNVMGSAGYIEKSRLVDRKEYAAGVGLSFPIWNGGEDVRREHAFKAKVEFERANFETARQEFAVQLKNMSDEYARQTQALAEVDRNESVIYFV